MRKKDEPLCDIQEIVGRVMVKFLANINVKNQIFFNKDEIYKGEEHIFFTDEEDYLYVFAGEKGAVKIRKSDIDGRLEIVKQGWDIKE